MNPLQTLVAQHGLISFDSILHKHERQVMDVTLPKDPRVFIKATPAKKARSGSGANSAAASAHGSTQGSTLVSRHASPPAAVSTLVGPLGAEARPAATDAQTAAAAAGATVRFSSDVKPGDATVCRPIVFAPPKFAVLLICVSPIGPQTEFIHSPCYFCLFIP